MNFVKSATLHHDKTVEFFGLLTATRKGSLGIGTLEDCIVASIL